MHEHVSALCALYVCTHTLKVFVGMMLRGIYGLKCDELTGGWKEIHDFESHDLYFTSDIGC